MQGRQGQEYDPRDRSSGKLLAATNGNDSGKQRAIPQRPPGMTRVERPPQTPRVARPQRQTKPVKSLGRRLLFITIIFVTCGIIAGIIGFALVNYFTGIGNSAGAANTATDFMLNLKSQSYDQAYNNDLDAKITISVTKDEFKQMALANDHCFGVVTDFNEVSGSAVSSNNDTTLSYAFSISRKQLLKPYQMTLTLQKDLNGNWDITSYGEGLGPSTPGCK